MSKKSIILSIVVLVIIAGEIYWLFFTKIKPCSGPGCGQSDILQPWTLSQIDAAKNFSYELIPSKQGGADMKVDVVGNETGGGYILTEGQVLYYQCNKLDFNYEKSTAEIKIFREINVRDCNEQGLFPYAYKARINDIAPGTYRVVLAERVHNRDGSTFDVEHVWQNGVAVKATNITTPSPNSTKQIRVVFPNGGETLEVGKTYNILWESKNIPSSEKVSISYSYGRKSGTIAAGITNSGNYSWKVSEIKVLGEEDKPNPTGPFYIRISHDKITGGGWEPAVETTSDQSDNSFTIVNTN